MLVPTSMLSASKGSGQHSQHGNVLMAWLCFVGLGAWIYHELGKKEFTAILTLSVFAQALAFMFLYMDISSSKSVAGISGRSMVMHAVKLGCRLSTTLWLDGYLPTDKSGDWIYQVGDVLSLLLVLQILFYIYVAHKGSYQSNEDTLDVRNLIMVAVVLAVVIHPNLNAWTPFDILWTVHLYVDAVAMVPQLWMMSKAGGQVRGFTAHYIGATLLSNFLSGMFWFYACPELAEENKLNIAGLAINGAHLVQLLLGLDVMYFYGKALLQGNCCATTMQMGQEVIDI